MIDLQFDRVAKKYLIRRETAGADAPQSSFLRRRREEFWALRNVNFEVTRGEALGIIGPNGAGKSTILKLLASITTPTLGHITIRGRLSALVEVGAGFHPELTGRENVYLSGSILGMRRSEITKKLDSIVEFSGVRQFLDMPVKHYSSGMYVRLGFSIAAHLDADILLLDEVLAVGDEAFQAKCLEHIEKLKQAGRTIIFISHNLPAVERLCDRVLFLQRGEIVATGSPAEMVANYQRSAGSFRAFEQSSQKSDGPRRAEITSFAFRDSYNRERSKFCTGEPLTARIHYAAHDLVPDATFHILFFTDDHRLLSHFTTTDGTSLVSLEPGLGTLDFHCAELGLAPGTYYVDVGIKQLGASSGHHLHWLERCLTLRVDPGKRVFGEFYMPYTWRIGQQNPSEAKR